MYDTTRNTYIVRVSGVTFVVAARTRTSAIAAALDRAMGRNASKTESFDAFVSVTEPTATIRAD